MRKNLILLLIASCFVRAAQTSAPQSEIYITHVTVIDTDAGHETTEQTVVISDGKISNIASSQNVTASANARIVDGKGKYLIPGLWDMHVHGTKFDSTLPLYIANGVTGVREMFGPPDANKFRAELAAKHLIAPHIYLASPIVDGKPAIVPDSIEVTTAGEARRAVDEQKQRGADFIKVYSLLSRDSYFAIIDEAGRQNIPVDGHVPNSVSVWEATAAKQRTIEHMFGVELGCSTREKELRPKFLRANPFKNEWDALLLESWQSYSDERCKGLFAELKKNGTWPVPTLAVRHSFGQLNDPQFTRDNRVRYFSGEFRDWVTGKFDARMKESSAADFEVIRKTFSAESRVTGELFRAGVPMLAGTDVGNPFCFPGFSLHDELALLVEAGVSPLGALQMATRNPAIFMHATDKYGSVAPGKIADLVLLDADPLKDIHNTTKISEVFLEGREYDRAALDQILNLALRKSETAMITDQSMDDASSKAEAELRAFMTELQRANVEGDVDTVTRSISDDYIQTDINGYRQDKTTWLNEYFKPLADLIKAGKFHWDEFERTNLQFRFYENCGIVTGELHAKGTGAKPGAQHTWVPDPNASFSGTLHFTHVYIRRNGKWMLAALHNQITPPPAKAIN